uniref:Uncharacterized protein n=1 Tax=Arundo donax TaxID=35708 RepID=A0A0A9ACK4_ARUDO
MRAPLHPLRRLHRGHRLRGLHGRGHSLARRRRRRPVQHRAPTPRSSSLSCPLV